jgi:HJR/Mrr/RecB family endonuclease
VRGVVVVLLLLLGEQKRKISTHQVDTSSARETIEHNKSTLIIFCNTWV